jgi:hypothetical protein
MEWIVFGVDTLSIAENESRRACALSGIADLDMWALSSTDTAVGFI